MPGGNVAVPLHGSTSHVSNGGRMVTADGRTLPLKGASLTADAKAGVVRVTLEQRFVNPYAEPLTVTYQMPLPADAAVSGFQFRIGDRRIVGEVDTKKKARERFDEAVLEGRTAALLDQDRSSLFTQNVGNIPPHTEVVSELQLDQKLQFLPDGYWEWRFPTVVAPRYLGAEGRVTDAARVTVDVADAAMPVKLSLQLAVRDRLPEGARPESPSHALHTVKAVQRFDVGFGAEGDASLDRDVVVRWKATEPQPGVELDTGRPIDGGAAGFSYGLLTLVPPDRDARMASVPRDLILLIDTSGSMGGHPLAQAQRVASALVDSLDEHDSLEMIDFGNSARRWRFRPEQATAANRKDAQAWIAKLHAAGGTEMRTGILEALAPLRPEGQRQIVLMTDGLIGFEHEIVRTICERLPSGSRVHTVGIGSGVNRSLTSPAARAGRGVEVVIGLQEDPERAAQRVLARTVQPLVTRVEISGSAVAGVAPLKPFDLYAGAPALASLKLHPHGGEIVVRGQTANGELFERIEVRPIERGEGSAAVAKLFARESVEDLEVELAAGGNAREIDQRITSLGIDFQISTRLTSWVAVSPEATVDPRAPKRKETVPQELPYGMSAEGLGLRSPMPLPPLNAAAPKARRLSAAPMAPSPAAPPQQQGIDQGSVEDDASDAQEEEAPSAEESAELEVPRREVMKRRDAPARGFGRPSRPAGSAKAPPPPRPTAGGVEGSAADRTRAGSAPAARRLKARLVLLKDGRLALELTVDGEGIAWTTGSASLRLKDGSFVGVTINTALTTAQGYIQPGMTVTVVVDVPAQLQSQPAELVVLGLQQLTLEIDG